MNKETILKVRDELYDSLPTGEINAFDLLTCIKNHLEKLDEIIDRSQDWVKVETPPNERMEYYLVCNMDLPEPQQRVYIAAWFQESKRFKVENSQLFTVTHYKPLPELPQNHEK